MRFDNIGLFWQDLPAVNVRGGRTLGPMPPIPETGWKPPTHFPNIIDAPWIALDCETFDPELDEHGPGWARGIGHIVGVSVATINGKWYFPMRHEVQKELNLDPELVLRYLRYSLSGKQPKIGANITYDIGWLQQEGVIVNGPLYDVQFAEGLLDETVRVSLESIARRHLGVGKTVDLLKEWAQQYYGTGEKNWRRDIYRCPPSLVGAYAEDDAALPYQVLMKQWPLLVSRGLLDLFEMECKLIRLLIAMRFKGISIDLPYAERLRDDFVARTAVAQKELDYIVGFNINVNSGAALASAFDKLGLRYYRTAPTERNPEGNPSFTQDFLKTVKHPLVEHLLKVRALEKLKSTFIEGYMLNAHVNGKVYGSFHPMFGEEGGAKTGRFSSTDPNLQNIPTRTEEGRVIRTAFIPDAGHRRFRSWDYSQIEYRMLMHFATGPGADDFRARYWADPKLDFHKMTGGMVKEFTGIELKRSYIKNVNFGIIYGVGIDHMAEMLGVPMSEARTLLGHYHTALPFAKATMRDVSAQVQRDGICYTILNRQTHFDKWESAEWGQGGNPLPYRAALAEWGTNIMRAYTYKALNYKLQGSAADMMKKAMVDCWEAGVFDQIGVPRMTVHDELDFSDPGDTPDDGWAELKHIMENCIPGIRVPIRVDNTDGNNWGECKD